MSSSFYKSDGSLFLNDLFISESLASNSQAEKICEGIFVGSTVHLKLVIDSASFVCAHQRGYNGVASPCALSYEMCTTEGAAWIGRDKYMSGLLVSVSED